MYKCRKLISKRRIVVCEDKEFISAKKCAEYYNVNYTTMANWLNHNNNMPKKWYDKGLRYKDENMEDYKISEVEIKQVICEDIVYKNVTECSKHYGVNRELLRSYLNGSSHIPDLWYERGLRYIDVSMEDYIRHYDYKLGNHPCAKKVICEGKIFKCAKECAEYYGVKDTTITSWLNHNNNMPQEFKDKGLKYYEQ